MINLEMRKLMALLSSFSFLALAQKAFADTTAVSIGIPTPTAGVNPGADPGTVISQIITIIFVLAIIVVLFMLVFGAFQWITSGGEKEGVGKARGRIISALVGLAILALSFFLVRIVGLILHIDLLHLSLPVLGS